MGEFLMPSLGADMDEGTLVEWMVAPGDSVHRGDIVAVVDTAKSAIEIEVFEDGVVDQLLVEPGTTVPVGAPLAVLRGEGREQAVTDIAGAGHAGADLVGTTSGSRVTSPIVRHLAHERGVDLDVVPGSGPDGAITRADVEAAAPPPAPQVSAAAPMHVVESEHSEAAPRMKASPFARRRASELGIDLAGVVGSGPDGVITVADVESASTPRTPPAPRQVPQKEAGPTPAAQEQSGKQATGQKAAVQKQAAMRAAIGALMARSKREIPHYYLTQSIDLRAASEWMHEANAGRGVEHRLVSAVLLLKASALAARKVPDVNGFFVDGAFVPSEHVHLGVAVSLRGGGLVAPAIHDADQRSLDELMSALKDVVARARSGRLKGSEMSDPTITVTNLGDQGVESVTGVIYPPQVALVGFGRVVERPWAADGMLGVHPVATATLAGDHRVTDGHRGGLFLVAIDDLLQRPEEL